MRLRVLILVSFAHFGGAQIAALRVARGLRDAGHDPHVIFLYEQGPIENPDHGYEVLVRKSRPGMFGYLFIALALWRRLRVEKPGRVLTFLPLAHVLGQGVALLTGTRIRVVSHRTPVNTISQIMRVLDAAAAWLRAYTGVVAVSESVRASCAHYPSWLRKKIAVVHNGIRDWRPSPLSRAEARRRFAVSEGAFVLAAVGRLSEQKNYPLMLRVAERLGDATVVIAGDGPLMAPLEAQVADAGLGNRVRLLGALPREAVPDLLKAADLFIQTSTYEGQSNSVLEALLAGLPVVAHDIPEQRETIADAEGKVAGALVPLNDIDAWVGAIERLRYDTSAAREIARERAEAFRYETMIAGFERALRGETAERRAPLHSSANA